MFGGAKLDKLEECLAAFAAEEKLEGFDCSTCNDKSPTTKTMRIQRFPECLVLHIIRFKRAPTAVSTATDRWIKFGTNVSFPLNGLHLSSLASDTITTEFSEADLVYDLYAVINHYGSRDFGHYTAFCKVQATDGSAEQPWLRFDDDKVTQARSATSAPAPTRFAFCELRASEPLAEFTPLLVVLCALQG